MLLMAQPRADESAFTTLFDGRSLDGWSVTDHLLHLAWWDDIRAVEVERISAGHDSSFQMTEDQDEDLPAGRSHSLIPTQSLKKARFVR